MVLVAARHLGDDRFRLAVFGAAVNETRRPSGRGKSGWSTTGTKAPGPGNGGNSEVSGREVGGQWSGT